MKKWLLAFWWIAVINGISWAAVKRDGFDSFDKIIDFSGLNLQNGALQIEPGESFDGWIGAVPPGAAFTAEMLPAGVELTLEGHLTGLIDEEGYWGVIVTATWPSGDIQMDSFGIEVRIKENPPEEEESDSGGGGGCNVGIGGWLLLAVFVASRTGKTICLQRK